jgi:hypothetical protein
MPSKAAAVSVDWENEQDTGNTRISELSGEIKAGETAPLRES